MSWNVHLTKPELIPLPPKKTKERKKEKEYILNEND